MPAHNAQDLTGQRFTRWLVLARDPDTSRGTYWQCRCDCGAARSVYGMNLTHGRSTSCGCLRREVSRSKELEHGLSKTPEHCIWMAMRERCLSPTSTGYALYGGRGITLCARWQSFTAFLEDMGPRPSPRHSIDRIDNSGPYSPDNCRWATQREQANNTRRNRRWTVNGITRTVAEWARVTGLPYHALLLRVVRRGWSTERAVSTPLRRHAGRPSAAAR